MPTLPPALLRAFEGYVQALADSGLAASTCRVYQSRVNGYLTWLAANLPNPASALRQPQARNDAVARYRQWLREDSDHAVSATNAVLTAVDHFYRWLGLGNAVVTRDRITPVPSATLGAGQRERMEAGIDATDTDEAARARVVLHLMLYAGLSGPEIADLDLSDVDVSGSQVTVASGPAPRTIPLHPVLAGSLAAWIQVRQGWLHTAHSPALLVSRSGRRLTSRSVTGIIQQLGKRTGTAVAPAALRATFATELESAGADPQVVAALTGHRANIHRQGSTPTADDLRAAVAALPGA